MNMAAWLFVGGILHFGILIGSGLVPFVLDFRGQLHRVDPLLRQLVWIYGIFIVLMIVGFGLVSVTLPGELASGQLLARVVCGFIGLFWFVRLIVQLFVFDAKPHLKSTFLRLGYHGLTVVFTYHAVVYTSAAMIG